MIIIKENGLALYFEVSEDKQLYFYGAKDENAPFEVPDEKVKSNYTAIELRTTGADTGRHLGGKSIGYLCPELPKYVSHESVEDEIGTKYVFTLETSLLWISVPK